MAISTRRAFSLLLAAALAGSCGAPQTSPSLNRSATPPLTTSPVAAPSAPPGARRPEVWFAPMPDAPPGLAVIDGADDYGDVLRPGAPWPVAAAGTDVFVVYHNWVRGYATPAEIKAVVAATKERGQGIGLEVGALSPEGCGDGIEGFDATLESLDLIHDAGGQVARIAFDEPFDFGHEYSGPKACRWPVEKVAKRVASFVGQLRATEPDALIGDIEGLTEGRTLPDLLGWVDAYRRVAGAPFDFVQLDVDWRQPHVVEDAVAAVRGLRSRGVPAGVIYNGGLASDDASWIAAAQANIAAVEDGLGGPPDQVIVQSWMHWPTRVLPETDPLTLSGLLRQYLVAKRSVLTLDPAIGTAGRAAVSGRLTTRDGARITEAPVAANAVSAEPAYRRAEITGTVPTDATQALVGLRVNSEYPDLRAAALFLYGVSYEENGGRNLVPDPDFAAGRVAWSWWGDAVVDFVPSDRGPGTMLTVRAGDDQSIVLNGTPFAVTPGAPFRLSASALVPGGGGAAPFVAVFFLRSDGNQTAQVRIGLSPLLVALGSRATDESGVFSFSSAIPSGSYQLTVAYAGSGAYWPTSATEELSIR
jgi:hypothetical protein